MPNDQKGAKRPGIVTAVVKSACLQRLWIGAAGVIGGTACALYTGNMSLWPAILCLIATLASQTGINLLRNYMRYKIAKEAFKGAKGLELPLDIVLPEAANGCFLIAGLAFAGLIFMSGLWALVPVALVALVGYFYIGAASTLFGTWWEQVCQFFFFGPVAVFCTFFYQALHCWGSFDMVMTDAGPAALTSLIIGLLAVNASLVGDCVSEEEYPQLNRYSFAATFGVKGVSWVMLFTGLVFYALEWVLCVKYPMPRWGLVMAALSLCFVLNLIAVICIRKASGLSLRRLYTLTILNPFIYSVVAMIVLMILREPDHGGFILFD